MVQPVVVHDHECKCFSWKPIIAGALMAIGLSFLLNLFSVAIGLTAYSTNSQGVENLAFGGLIATALSLVVSMFASGWLAGYLGNRYCTKRHLGALYGFLAWCVALVAMIFLAAHVQQYIGFYTHVLNGTSATYVYAPVANANAAPVPTPPANAVVLSTYILFTLFFLSAFAASFGGHSGMRYVDREERRV